MTWSHLLGESGDAGIINMEDDDDDSDEETETGPDGVAHGSGASAHSSSSTAGGIMHGLLANISGFTTPAMAVEEATSTTGSGAKPFENLRDLMCHHAHLAVLLNYVISNSDPAPLVSLLLHRSA